MGDHNSKIRKTILTTKARQYLYGIMLVCAPLAVAYGIVSDSEAGLWLALAGAILGVSNSVALVNVPRGADNASD